jgi:hypothetical protein
VSLGWAALRALIGRRRVRLTELGGSSRKLDGFIVGDIRWLHHGCNLCSKTQSLCMLHVARWSTVPGSWPHERMLGGHAGTKTGSRRRGEGDLGALQARGGRRVLVVLHAG